MKPMALEATQARSVLMAKRYKRTSPAGRRISDLKTIASRPFASGGSSGTTHTSPFDKIHNLH
jgi:hypothetical protein